MELHLGCGKTTSSSTNIETLEPYEREEGIREHQEVGLKKYYEMASRKFNPRLIETPEATQIGEEHQVPALFNINGRSWTDGPIPLRHILIQITENWEQITGNISCPCPISFSLEEITQSATATEAWAEAYNELQTLRSSLVGRDGWVSHDEYVEEKAVLDAHHHQLKHLQDKLKLAGGTEADFVV